MNIFLYFQTANTWSINLAPLFYRLFSPISHPTRVLEINKFPGVAE